MLYMQKADSTKTQTKGTKPVYRVVVRGRRALYALEKQKMEKKIF